MNDHPQIVVVAASAEQSIWITTQLRARGYTVGSYSAPEHVDFKSLDGALGCLIADASSLDVDALKAQKLLEQSGSTLGFVAIVPPTSFSAAVSLMKAGAAMVLAAPCRVEELLTAVEAGVDMSRMKRRVASARREYCDRLSRLSQDELAVMEGMIAGKPIKLLARELDVSMRTIERRRRTVLSTLQANSIGQLGMMLARFDSPQPINGFSQHPSVQRVC